MKLNAYQCWKEKTEKNLSNEDYKKLLIENGIINKKDKIMNKEILLVWQGTNEQSSGTITETDDMIVVYLDNRSKWEQMEKDIEAYKNRIKVLQNLNEKYREKLGISNEPIDALGLISPLEDSSSKAE